MIAGFVALVYHAAIAGFYRIIRVGARDICFFGNWLLLGPDLFIPFLELSLLFFL